MVKTVCRLSVLVCFVTGVLLLSSRVEVAEAGRVVRVSGVKHFIHIRIVAYNLAHVLQTKSSCFS